MDLARQLKSASVACLTRQRCGTAGVQVWNWSNVNSIAAAAAGTGPSNFTRAMSNLCPQLLPAAQNRTPPHPPATGAQGAAMAKMSAAPAWS